MDNENQNENEKIDLQRYKLKEKYFLNIYNLNISSIVTGCQGAGMSNFEYLISGE